MLFIVLLFFAVNSIKQYALFKSDNAIYKLSSLGDRKLLVELKNGKVFQAKVISAECLFDYFTVFVLQNNARKYKSTIAKDTLSQEQFYTLRLYLRSFNKLR